jgi:hypothetical protein
MVPGLQRGTKLRFAPHCARDTGSMHAPVNDDPHFPTNTSLWNGGGGWSLRVGIRLPSELRK